MSPPSGPSVSPSWKTLVLHGSVLFFRASGLYAQSVVPGHTVLRHHHWPDVDGHCLEHQSHEGLFLQL